MLSAYYANLSLSQQPNQTTGSTWNQKADFYEKVKDLPSSLMSSCHSNVHLMLSTGIKIT
jgi:hypothetical protein